MIDRFYQTLLKNSRFIFDLELRSNSNFLSPTIFKLTVLEIFMIHSQFKIADICRCIAIEPFEIFL